MCKYFPVLFLLLLISNVRATEYFCPYEVSVVDGSPTRKISINRLTAALRADQGLSGRDTPWLEDEVAGETRTSPNRAIVTLPDKTSAEITDQVVAPLASGGAECSLVPANYERRAARAPRLSGGSLSYDDRDATRVIVNPSRDRVRQGYWPGFLHSLVALFWTSATPSVAWALTDAPMTAVLDTFDRTAEDPLTFGGLWSTSEIVSTTATGLQTDGDQVHSDGGAGPAAYWVASFGANQEAYITWDIAGGSTALRLYISIQSAGSTGADGYNILFNPSGGVIELYRVDDAVNTQIGADITQANDTGDAGLLRKVGSTLSVGFSDDGGAWSTIRSDTDSTYSGGNVGLRMVTSTHRGNNFGGGTLSIGGLSLGFKLLR